ncbi:hypothetical protein QN277_001217 [Acacia crassicarpa]|uniref:Uncharacterized protein n=1 Tax=Acacia crassicarpa TaxID=499986 RepID=A0AAE1TGJ8_9FABA|nr:hypothetical protein QN277_001217 [Acacia crassicarpa]
MATSSSLAAASSRSNPNLRNSEINNSVRRSFSGNPFHKPSIIANPRSFTPNTPANSPSDFPRRNSIGDLDDKENGKDHILKSSKVRSPAASTKGMKNFMSPTISAASKITESPRKKVLADRNEAARTSFSSSTEVKIPNPKVTVVDSMDEKTFKAFSDGIIKEEREKHKSPNRKVTFADSVEEKTFQPFPDWLAEEDRDEQAASMVSEDLKMEAKSPNGKVTFADSIEEKKFQPFTDGVIEDDTEEHTSSIVSEDLKDEGLESKNETESAYESVTNELDCVNLDPSFRLSPTPPPFSSTSTIIAPLDADPLIPPFDPKADPLVPPYDPKVNYLSPRPQFLRYKPNPRLQLYKERESMKLDDGSSDTEMTEEESEVSSDETVTEDQNHVSESSITNGTLMPEEEIAEAKGVAKPGFSMISKAIALLLLLSVACFSISYTNPQVFDPVLKEITTWSQTCDSSEFYQFATANFDRFSGIAKENLDGLSRNFHTWLIKWMSSFSELISSFRGVQGPGQLHYWNLTDLTENTEVYQFPIFAEDGNLIQQAPQVGMPVLIVEETDDIGDIIMADHYASAYEEQVQELEPVSPITDDNDAAKEINTDAVVITEVESDPSASNIGGISEPNQCDSNPDSDHEILTEDFEANNLQAEKAAPEDAATGSMDLKEGQSDVNSEVAETAEVHPDSEPKSEIHTEDFEANSLQAENAAPEDAATGSMDLKEGQSDLSSEVAETTEILTDSELKSETHDVLLKSEEKSLVAVIVASIFLFLSIIAGVAFKFLKKKDEGRRRTMATTNASSMEQPAALLLTKALHKDEEEAASSPEKPFLRNNPIEMDVHGESYQPSEISSFERSSSYYYNRRATKEKDEAQSSLEKKPKRSNRRESLASSSDTMAGSASYGSFTTYEKLPNKQELGTVTPVRRSSRIRNLVNSPV